MSEPLALTPAGQAFVGASVQLAFAITAEKAEDLPAPVLAAAFDLLAVMQEHELSGITAEA